MHRWTAYRTSALSFRDRRAHRCRSIHPIDARWLGGAGSERGGLTFVATEGGKTQIRSGILQAPHRYDTPLDELP